MTPVRRTLLALLTIAVLVVAAGALYVRHWLAQPLALGAEPAIVEVQPGQTLTAVARELAARGLLTHPRLLALYGRFIGADSRMHAGEFSIKPGTSPRGLLQALVGGAVVQHAVTIVEGWTFRELRKALAAVPTLQHTTAAMQDDAVMRALGEDGKRPKACFSGHLPVRQRHRDIDLLRQSRSRMRGNWRRLRRRGTKTCRSRTTTRR
jgi:UPF0755 protein